MSDPQSAAHRQRETYVDPDRWTDEAESRPGAMGKYLAAGAIALGSGLLITLAASGRREGPYRSDAPERARRHGYAGNVVGRTVTINRPRRELYAYLRDFSNLPRFMENVRSVEKLDERRSRWTIEGPGGRAIEFESSIVEERPDELIEWRSAEGSPVRNRGRIVFRDAPNGRGTEVEATIAYEAPGGAAGRAIAKLFQVEPKIQARRELKRFKQLMETGEIATSARRPKTERAT